MQGNRVRVGRASRGEYKRNENLRGVIFRRLWGESCLERADCSLEPRGFPAWVAQLVERVLGKDEVTGSIPVPGSSLTMLGIRVWEGPSGGNSTVESHSSKVMVAGSNPVPRSKEFSGGCSSDSCLG